MSWEPDPESVKALQEQLAAGKTHQDFQREAGEALLEREEILNEFVEVARGFVQEAHDQGTERVMSLADYFGNVMLEFQQDSAEDPVDPETLMGALIVALYKLAEQQLEIEGLKEKVTGVVKILPVYDTQHRKGS